MEAVSTRKSKIITRLPFLQSSFITDNHLALTVNLYLKRFWSFVKESTDSDAIDDLKVCRHDFTRAY